MNEMELIELGKASEETREPGIPEVLDNLREWEEEA